MEPYEKARELLDRISKPCPLDGATKLYRHIDERGKVCLVTIPENEEDQPNSAGKQSTRSFLLF